jgi:hypothetical protein
MHKPPRLFQIFALGLVLAMTWANLRGHMISSLFNDSDPASRSASGQVSHK